MKKILHITLICFTTLNFANAQWQITNDSIYGNINCFAISGKNIFAGTGSGVYLSSNNGSNWTAINTGLDSQIKGISSLAVSGSKIFAGTNKGVFLSNINGASWYSVNSGLKINDELYQVPITDKDVLSLATSGNKIFAGTYRMGIFLSKNNGVSWKNISIGIGARTLAIIGDTIFAGTYRAGIYLSKNNGLNWKELPNGMAYKGIPYNAIINSIAIKDTNIFAGTDKGIFLSTDNGAIWNVVNNGLTNIQVNCLAISGDTIFAGTNREKTFISANINGKNISPGIDDYNGGIFLSLDNGKTWENISKGFPINFNVLSLAISGSYIFAGTNSGGIWELLLSKLIIEKNK